MKTSFLQMKKTLRAALFILLLGALGVMKGYAQNLYEFVVGDLIYLPDDFTGTVSVIGHVDGFSATGALVIPESVEYNNIFYTVTVINAGAFDYCTGLSGSLIIPNSVTSIGDMAFRGCSGFTGNLILSDNLTSIGYQSFSDCSGFTGDLVIPDNVTSIDNSAFYGCSGFTGDLVIPNNVTSIGDSAFGNCSGFTGNLSSLADSLTFLGAYAFSGCSGFAEVHYNITNYQNIDSYCISPNIFGPPFNGCGGTLIIGENVETIPDGMFIGGAFTGELYIPDSVTVIRKSAFSGCNGFTGGLYLSNFVTEIGESAFSGCNGFNSLTLSENLTTIENGTFSDCSGFTGSLTIPSKVREIGNSAFIRCYSFTSLTLSNSINTIGQEAFGECNGFTGDLVIPSTVDSIGERAFMSCVGFTSLFIPSSVILIGSGAFGNCGGLEQIVVGSGNINYDSRGNCNALIETYSNTLLLGCKNTIIPNSVTSIGGGAFSMCTGLTSLNIPNSVTSIGDGAFYMCSGLISLNIPNSVTSIGDSAFFWCSGLISLIISDSVTKIGFNTFTGCSSLNSFVIPESVTEIGDYAFNGCSSLTSLIIPNSVTRVGSYAFKNCSSLTQIIIGKSVTIILADPFTGDSSLTTIIMLPTTPPIIGSSTIFPSSNPGFTIYVPCEAVDAYLDAENWSVYGPYIEPMCNSGSFALTAGWNWFSSNIEITLEDLQTALVEALPGTTSITIKAQNGQSTKYNGSSWRGALNLLEVSQMYKVQVNTGCEITLTGLPTNPTNHPVTVTNGVNWIAFPLSESMAVDDAFIGFAIDGDQVKSQAGTTAKYNGTIWRPSITLEPGNGYIYKSSATETRTFIFPTSTK